MQQIEHEAADPSAVLHWSGHPIGEHRPRLRAARCTAAVMSTVFGDDQRPWFGQVDHLPGDMAGGHRHGQRLAARGTGLRIMVDDRIGRLVPAQSLAWMALLPARLLAGGFPQTADPVAASPVRRWTGACRYCCCSIRAGAPIRQCEPATPL